MGFDERYVNRIAVSDTQAYKQFGNAVVPRVVQAVASEILKVLSDGLLKKNGCLLKRAS
jgi:DNA (cytosine-5)-methyltransferase 1